jgi:hypothetical protein
MLKRRNCSLGAAVLSVLLLAAALLSGPSPARAAGFVDDVQGKTTVYLKDIPAVGKILNWPVNFHLATIATFLLVLRDVGFIYLINIARHSPRNDMTAFVYITLAWTVVPVTLSAMGMEPATAFFWPMWDSSAPLTIGPPLVQLLLVYGLFWHVWQAKVARAA